MPNSPAVATRSDPFRLLIVLVFIIVVAILVVFAYFASSLCITLLLAGFLAILLDPIPTLLERWFIPRSASSALVVLVCVGLIGALIYASYGKATLVVDTIPEYVSQVREAIKPLSHNIEKVQKSAGTLTLPEPSKKLPEVSVKQPPSWPSYLVRGVSSIWGAMIIASVVPFLTFFMLVRKSHIYSWLSSTFGQMADVPRFIGRLTHMVRGFVIGNIIIGSLMAAITTAVLFGIKMEGALALGVASGVLNLVPFVGVVFAALLPLLAATLQFHTLGPFVVICLTVSLLHLISANFLLPKWVGGRLNVGPVAAMVGLLFWGWLWGVMGILLAVPLTALVKLVADCNPALLPLSTLIAGTPKRVPS